MGKIRMGASILGALALGSVLTGWAGRETVNRAAFGPEADFASALLASARGTSPDMCQLAARAVEGRYGGWGGFGPPTMGDTSGAVRWALGRRLGEDAVPVLLAGVADSDGCVQAIAARLMAHAESPAATRGLLQALGSGSPATRVAASVALGLSDAVAALDPLIQRLRDATVEVRAVAAWALGAIDESKAVAPLREVLKDDAPLVRAAAATALGRLEDTSAVNGLARLLRSDPDERVSAGGSPGTWPAGGSGKRSGPDRRPERQERRRKALQRLGARQPGERGGG